MEMGYLLRHPCDLEGMEVLQASIRSQAEPRMTEKEEKLINIRSNLDSHQKNWLMALVKKCQWAFAYSTMEHWNCQIAQHRINTGGTHPSTYPP